MNLWRSLALDCRDAARAQSEALDHPLPGGQRFGLWLHLVLCKWCRRYGRQLTFLRAAAHQHADELVDASSQKLSLLARDRIKRRLQENR